MVSTAVHNSEDAEEDVSSHDGRSKALNKNDSDSSDDDDDDDDSSFEDLNVNSNNGNELPDDETSSPTICVYGSNGMAGPFDLDISQSDSQIPDNESYCECNVSSSRTEFLLLCPGPIVRH